MPSRLVAFYIVLAWLGVFSFLPLVIFSQPPTDTLALKERIVKAEGKIWGNYPEEFKKAKSIYSEAKNSDCVKCKYRVEFMMGKYYWANGLYAKGSDYFRIGLRGALRAKDTLVIGYCYHYLAVTHYYQAYYDSAFHYYQKAYDVL
ncbi:MAG: hypothetical protein HC811_14280 [Flammeovirgaceae bacterium]|nr:hypothetical protein [Flammeovirgaceae bacterium]